MTIDYRVGDTRDLIAAIPDGSISLVASSPPFLALRSYLPAGHDDKHAEIGSEPDPATFLDTLLALTAEWGRVLAPWGSIAIELGDTYAGSGGAGGDYNMGGRRDGQNAYDGSSKHERRTDTKRTKVSDGSGSAISDLHGKVQGGGNGWPRAKSLALIPQLYATSLAYGRNILTGTPSPAGQWLVRNVIVWHRPNPAPGALGDKFRPSTSYIVVATRSAKRWFDLTAVRTAHADPKSEARRSPSRLGGKAALLGCVNLNGDGMSNPAGAPPLDTWTDHEDDYHDTWTITTQPSRLSHYAMWPPRLAERLILSMCPHAVCNVCGEPRRRVEVTTNAVGKRPVVAPGVKRSGLDTDALGVRYDLNGGPDCAERETLGWTDCGCLCPTCNGEGVEFLGDDDDIGDACPDCDADGRAPFTPGTVLDPFAGTFTTGLVAEYHGRDAIGIDLDPRNADLVPARREEVRRALNPTHIRGVAGQLDMFEEMAL